MKNFFNKPASRKLIILTVIFIISFVSIMLADSDMIKMGISAAGLSVFFLPQP